ncbi:MAG: hypothetical protein K6E29_06260 [Cyanobacteria bacterium RUI128]|nr:hypothetical protein [Cyanobacteria bacterium RUI128]
MKKLALKDKNLYYIGGVVRDELLQKESFDLDITYVGNALDFCKGLEEKKIGKILQINEPFGTVRMVIDGEEVDIASTRDEIYPEKGHLPVVSDIGCELKKDVLRRDFTINAMAKSTCTDEIIDYTGGQEDLKNKTLRVLHDNSFIDDPTRIVRGLKFSVRFGFKLDEHTKNLQENYLKNINRDMSYKRLKKELMETFNLNSQKAFDEFFNQKIYKLLTEKDITPPEYNIENLVNKYPVQHTWLVYIGWLNLDNLPLTKEEKKIIDDYSALINTEINSDNYSVYKAFYGRSKEAVLLYTIISGKDYGLRYFKLQNISPEINGDDLKNLGIEPSKRYSECFDYVLENKLKNPNLSKEDELNLAKIFFKQS